MALAMLQDEQDQNVALNRLCRIELHPNEKRTIPLKWNVGGKHGRDTVQYLVPGKNTKATVELYKAQAWFGMFTIPTMLRGETNEQRIKDLKAQYRHETKRTLDTWDYPRPRKLSEGTEPIGPHRFPDLIVTVIEQNGDEWAPIRLHELYGIGEFDPTEFAPQQAAEAEWLRIELERERAEKASLAKTVAKLDGAVSVLLAERTGKK